MSSILVTGRMSRRTLQRALYAGWDITSYEGTDDACVAVVTATVGNPSVDYMVGRLSSFGTVGVRTDYTPNDYAEALNRLRSQRQVPLDPDEVTAALHRLTAGATPVEVMTGMTTEELDTLGGEPK